MQDREFWKLFESTGTPAAYLIYAKHKKQTEVFTSRAAQLRKALNHLMSRFNIGAT